jgi:hypothetical protein
MTTIHTLLAMASVREWSISQLDVENAFFNSEMCEDVYMRPPPGYSIPEGMAFTFATHFVALSRLIKLGFNILPLWSQL